MSTQKVGPLRKALHGYYLKYYFEPEYVFRPKQVIRHIAYFMNPDPKEFLDIDLPWGSKIKVRQNEYIGRNIRNKGLYDIVVCEAISRLLDPNEYAIDVGANIGQMTSLMAAKVGTGGRVFAFEPHPEIFEELKHNVSIGLNGPVVSLHKMALGDHDGEAVLQVPEGFGENRGLASLVAGGASGNISRSASTVKIRRLDHIVGTHHPVGLMKIDVEGHELGVLEGATDLIDGVGVRDILFEDHAEDPYHTAVAQFFKQRNYSLFYLARNMFGLRLGDLKFGKEELKGATYYNCLATTEPERALMRLQTKGWLVLNEKQRT